MKIETRKLKDLKPFDGNPRKINAKDMEKLKKSITEFGDVEPLVIRSEDNLIIGGHQRHKAMTALGMKDAECVIVDGVNDDRAKALNVALNKIAGDWDWEKLEEIMEDLHSNNFDLTLLGFDDDELSSIIENLNIDFPEFDKDAKDDVKFRTCPKCGHEFPV